MPFFYLAHTNPLPSPPPFARVACRCSSAALTYAPPSPFPHTHTLPLQVLQHGACLGLGVAAMGSASDPLYASLRDILFQDSATAGEAAGLGIGLLLCGRGPAWTSDITGESVSSEMLTYAHATQHEKAIRGIALGLALQVRVLECVECSARGRHAIAVHECVLLCAYHPVSHSLSMSVKESHCPTPSLPPSHSPCSARAARTPRDRSSSL